jgi:alpha-amylase
VKKLGLGSVLLSTLLGASACEPSRSAEGAMPGACAPGTPGCAVGGGPDAGAPDLSSGDSDGGPPGGNPTPAFAVVQLFDWSFQEITAELPRLSALGYTHVHVSPPTLSHPNPAWWARYQVVDYRVIDGPLGDENAFRAMIAAARANGIGIVADVVLNHMANLGASYDLTFPPPAAQQQQLYGKSYPSLTDPLFTAADFHAAFCISDYNQPQEVRDGRICGGGGDTGLPDLRETEPDHTTVIPHVLSRQRDYLQKLIALGVAGFRIDALKHMEPAYIAALLQGLPNDLLLFGESLGDATQAAWSADLTPYIQLGLPLRYYDFPLVHTLHDALASGGDLRSLTGDLSHNLKAIPDPLAVTFVVEHDIPMNPFAGLFMGRCKESDRYGDPVNEALGYAFILGRKDGIPYVYSDRGTTGNDGVPTDSYRNAHRRCDRARMLRFHALTAGLAEAPLYSAQQQLLFARGKKGVVAINTSTASWQSSSAGSIGALDDGTYVDVLSGKTLQVTGGHLGSFTLAPRTAAMFLHDSIFTPARAASLSSLSCDTPAPPPCSP